MGKVQFQVDGLDSNTTSIFNDDVTFDGNVDANSISISGINISNIYATQLYVSNAISSSSVDFANTAGYGIDWNVVSNQFDIANTIATTDYVNLIQYGNAISGTTYTLSSSDLGKLIETTSSSSITVTIPSDPSDSAFPIGSSVEFRQMGTGRITFSPTSPATMVSTDSYTKTRGQYSSVVLEKRASNAWILAGDIDA